MFKIIFVLSVLAGVGITARLTSQRQEFKGFQVVPQNEAQVQFLKNFRDSNNPEVYFKNGPIQENQSQVVWVKKTDESKFLRAMNAQGVNHSLLYDRIKVKLYQNRMSAGQEVFTRNILRDGDDDPCRTEGQTCYPPQISTVNQCCAGYFCAPVVKICYKTPSN